MSDHEALLFSEYWAEDLESHREINGWVIWG
jgi:hypothetical protein